MHIENLEIGMWVTIESCKNGNPDRSYRGDPLKIVAINHPYIVVKTLNPLFRAISLDTREVNLMLLSKDYVEALGGIFDYAPKTREER
jgi:hypothetical protein